MNSVKIKLNPEGIRELLNSPEITAAVREAAEGVSGRAGSGYEVDVRAGKKRAVAEVRPVTKEAKNDTFESNALLKALFG